jgi:hypothetical protein
MAAAGRDRGDQDSREQRGIAVARESGVGPNESATRYAREKTPDAGRPGSCFDALHLSRGLGLFYSTRLAAKRMRKSLSRKLYSSAWRNSSSLSDGRSACRYLATWP